MKQKFIMIFSFFMSTLVIPNQAKELHWNWDCIDQTKVYFPSTFLWGTSDSAIQAEGIETAHGKTIENNWTRYEEKRNIPLQNRAGIACERWTRYKSDIKLMKNLGMNIYRFSIAWSKIEPEEGVFDADAMQHYIDVIDELLAQSIIPMPTLFHHTCPIWFEQKGGFEHEQNTIYFLAFARYVFEHLHNKVHYWIIFNEPVAYAMEAYRQGNYPPGKKSLKCAGIVAQNMLNAHVHIAQHLKKIDPQVQIGIAHVFNLLDPYSSWNPIERIATKLFDYIVNDLTIDFFRKGKFNWLYLIRDKNKKAKKSLDFIGINYYTHTTIKQTGLFSFAPTARPDEIILSEAGPDRGSKVMYPEGLYLSIKKAAKLYLPIYITENGCSTENEQLKDEYIKKHLYVISCALKEQILIKGYMYWTITDCFCWNKGYRNKHGIYAVDFKTQERTYRSVFDYLINVIKTSRGIV